MSAKRAKRRSKARIALSISAMLVLLASVAYFIITTPRSESTFVGAPVPQATFGSLTDVATAPYGDANSSFTSHFGTLSAQTHYDGSRPIVLFIGADPCGLCAGERWPLVLALLRFGNFSNLKLMTSGTSDAFPSVPTFSFHGSTYFSNYVEFQGYEIATQNGSPQDRVPSNYTQDWRRNNSTVPYLTFANSYIVLGSFSPASIEGLNWTQVISLVQTSTGVGPVIKQLANDMTAVICAVDGNRPSQVCTQPAIAGFLLIGTTVTKGSATDFAARPHLLYSQTILVVRAEPLKEWPPV